MINSVFRGVFVFVAPVILSACVASVPVSGQRNNFSGSSQIISPVAIIVRNHSGTDFASASLAALPDDKYALRSFGEIAPVPDRVEQVYGRSELAQPLPDVVELRLQTIQEKTTSRTFHLDMLMPDADKFSSAYVLVFVLKPGGEIQALLEGK
jgi:hypothetical protein